MAYIADGKKFTCDYSILLEDIRFELKEGMLKNDTVINIVRSSRSLENIEYRPIIDYYHLDELELIEREDFEDEFYDEEWLVGSKTKKEDLLEQYFMMNHTSKKQQYLGSLRKWSFGTRFNN